MPMEFNTYGILAMDSFDYYRAYRAVQEAKRTLRVEHADGMVRDALDPRKNKSHPLADKKWGSNLDVKA
tara:strand:+ start:1514 stop:1720 length:207 start_codon:yes stop_codon:yes gene_type:complete